jgi:branched-chain amino acid transport system ATP-binding protein
MLTIARTLMGNPEMILLDEPTEGLAPIVVQAIGDLIKTLRARGVTILLAEQNMHFCLGIATHATVIDKGQIVYRATTEELRHNQEVKQRYLAI